MNKEVIKRAKEVADYIIKTKNTIRETAKVFKVSKSTIHKDIQQRLKISDIEKFKQVEKIFNDHIQIRHILGGQSTKNRYEQLRNSKG